MNYALLLYTITYFLESSPPLHILQREVDLIKINVNKFTISKVCCYPVFKEIKQNDKDLYKKSSNLIVHLLTYTFSRLDHSLLVHFLRLGWRILSKIKAFSLRWYFFYSHKPCSWWCVDVVRRKLMLITLGEMEKSRAHSLGGLLVQSLWVFFNFSCTFTLTKACFNVLGSKETLILRFSRWQYVFSSFSGENKLWGSVWVMSSQHAPAVNQCSKFWQATRILRHRKASPSPL